MRLSEAIQLRFGYDVVGRIGRDEPKAHHLYGEAEVRIPVLDAADAPSLATLVRGDLGTITYRSVDGLLIRSCAAGHGEPLTLDRLAEVHAEDSDDRCEDYPCPPHVGTVYCGSALRLRDARESGLRAVKRDDASYAEVAAAAFFGGLRIVDGIVHKPCTPPAWGVTYRDTTAIAPCVPELDLPYLRADRREWKPSHWEPGYLLEPGLSVDDISDACRESGLPCAFGDGQGISVHDPLPVVDLGRDSAWLLRRRLANQERKSLWGEMDPLRRLRYAAIDVACGRYLGEIDGGASLDDLREACAGGLDDDVAAEWLACDRVAALLADRSERETSFLAGM